MTVTGVCPLLFERDWRAHGKVYSDLFYRIFYGIVPLTKAEV